MWSFHLKTLVSKVKWPGWGFILLWVFTQVPDWQSRIQFWLDASKKVSGRMDLIVVVLSSPWFSRGLLVFGVSYLLFIGEPKRTVRHPIWQVIGWSIFGVVAIGLSLVLFAGFIVTRADQNTAAVVAGLGKKNEQLSDQVSRLQEQSRPWEMTEEQKTKLAAALDKVPQGETYRLALHVIPGCNQCSAYADDIENIVSKTQGWEIKGDTYYALNPHLTGIIIGIDQENPCPGGEIQLIKDALDTAGIPYIFSLLGPKDKSLVPTSGYCVMLVGDKPQKQLG